MPLRAAWLTAACAALAAAALSAVCAGVAGGTRAVLTVRAAAEHAGRDRPGGPGSAAAPRGSAAAPPAAVVARQPAQRGGLLRVPVPAGQGCLAVAAVPGVGPAAVVSRDCGTADRWLYTSDGGLRSLAGDGLDVPGAADGSCLGASPGLAVRPCRPAGAGSWRLTPAAALQARDGLGEPLGCLRPDDGGTPVAGMLALGPCAAGGTGPIPVRPEAAVGFGAPRPDRPPERLVNAGTGDCLGIGAGTAGGAGVDAAPGTAGGAGADAAAGAAGVTAGGAALRGLPCLAADDAAAAAERVTAPAEDVRTGPYPVGPDEDGTCLQAGTNDAPPRPGSPVSAGACNSGERYQVWTRPGTSGAPAGPVALAALPELCLTLDGVGAARVAGCDGTRAQRWAEPLPASSG